MKTLHDVLLSGNAAESAGSPIVPNWPQVRGAILLIGRACDLAQIAIEEAPDLLPEDFAAMPANIQGRLISNISYKAAGREVLRLLALYATPADPWDALLVFIRRADRPDIENALYHLRAPARNAGLRPSQITTEWFNLHDEAAGVGPRRQSLRAGATAFNKLFGLPEIMVRGLLPPRPIGPFLSYDGLGRRLHDLPPLLHQVQQQDHTGQGAIASIWQAICVSGNVNLPADLAPGDLLEESVWRQIDGLSGALIGVSDRSLRRYKGRLRRGLEKVGCASRGTAE